jgi:hypothetical protein
MKSNYDTATYTRKIDSAKGRNQVVGEEIKYQRMDTEAEDNLISLLHLDNLSGLRRIKKCRSLDYKALEEYIYSDIILEETPNPNRSNESEMEDDSQHAR